MPLVSLAVCSDSPPAFFFCFLFRQEFSRRVSTELWNADRMEHVSSSCTNWRICQNMWCLCKLAHFKKNKGSCIRPSTCQELKVNYSIWIPGFITLLPVIHVQKYCVKEVKIQFLLLKEHNDVFCCFVN